MAALLTSRQKMGAAALIMAFSVLLSRFMGLARDKVISWQFGAGGESDVYFAAFVVPDFLNYLLAGGYLSITLIPLLARRFEEDEADGWRFFGTVFFWATLSIGALTLLAWFAAPTLAPLVAPGFDAARLERLTSFLRIVLPAQIFFLPGACLSAVLYVRRQFTVPALMPLIYNGFILLFGVGMPALGLAKGMEGFCWGVLAGAAVGAFLLPLLAVHAGGLRLVPSLRHALMPRFLLLALPLMVGQSVVVLDEQFIRIFGSMAGDGAVSLLNYARRIMMVPVGVVAQAAGVASFPFLAALASDGKEGDFAETLRVALRNSLIIIIPMSAWMISAAFPLLGFIFEGGSFGPAQTASTAPLLALMLLAVPFWAMQQVTGRAFYARQDTLTPALAGTAATLVVVPLYIVLAPRFGAGGVALVTSCSVMLYALALMAVARRRWGLVAVTAFAGLPGVAVRSVLLALPGCAASVALSMGMERFALALSPLARQFITLSLGGLLFVALYVWAARRFVPEYARIALGPFMRLRERLRQRSKHARAGADDKNPSAGNKHD